MKIEFSDIISCAALAASILSILYTRRQISISYRTQFNDHRAHLAEHHAVYRAALNEIQKKHRNDIQNLSEVAGSTLTNIVNFFDNHDKKRDEERYLRHLVHESSEMVFYAFKGQLAWQTSLNIFSRWAQTSYIEDDLKPQNNILGNFDFRSIMYQKYLDNPNLHMEFELWKDIHFCDLVSKIKSRINSETLENLLHDIQKELDIFCAQHDKLKSTLSQSIMELKDLIYEGNKEQFQLKESVALYNEMKHKLTILETLKHIYFPELDKKIFGHYYNSVSKSIFACSILHAIQGIHTWGWIYEE